MPVFCAMLDLELTFDLQDVPYAWGSHDWGDSSAKDGEM